MADRIYAHIHSLKGEMGEAYLLKKRNTGITWNGQYIAYRKGIMCTAIFNPFVCEYYVDDKFDIILPEKYAKEGITDKDLEDLARAVKEAKEAYEEEKQAQSVRV